MTSPNSPVPHPDPVPLASGRLLLRPPTLADAPQITQACQDETLAYYVPVPVPYLPEHAVSFVESRPAAWADEHGEMTWAVTNASSGDLLGMVGLHAKDPTMREIGFWTAPWARGQGVMTEAARLACEFGFDVLGLERIEWWAREGNLGSRRVAEKLGFTMEGTCRARLLHRGERVDGWVGGLLRGELT